MIEVISVALLAGEPFWWSFAWGGLSVSEEFSASGPGSGRVLRMVDRGEKTYGHLVEALRAGIAVEKCIVLRPEAIYAEGREVGLVRWTCHRWVVDHEIGFAGIDVESPDAS